MRQRKKVKKWEMLRKMEKEGWKLGKIEKKIEKENREKWLHAGKKSGESDFTPPPPKKLPVTPLHGILLCIPSSGRVSSLMDYIYTDSFAIYCERNEPTYSHLFKYSCSSQSTSLNTLKRHNWMHFALMPQCTVTLNSN